MRIILAHTGTHVKGSASLSRFEARRDLHDIWSNLLIACGGVILTVATYCRRSREGGRSLLADPADQHCHGQFNEPGQSFRESVLFQFVGWLSAFFVIFQHDHKGDTRNGSL